MKKAFSLLELTFVIVVIGILTAVIIPNTKSTSLQEAAIQVASHIRYTQHLAMIDDRFGSTGSDNDYRWYQTRWQIVFTDGTEASLGKIAYAVFSDFGNSNSGKAEIQELALDPQTKRYITGGVTNGVEYIDDNVFHPANIGLTYGVDTISFSASCQYYNSMRIAFDHLGRPMKGNLASYSSAYPATNRMITETCIITLGSNNETVSIHIEPETGYTHIPI